MQAWSKLCSVADSAPNSLLLCVNSTKSIWIVWPLSIGRLANQLDCLKNQIIESVYILQYYVNIFIYEKCAWFSWDRVINVDQHLHACLLFFTLVRQLGIESSNPRSSIHCIRSRSTFPGFLSQWVFSGFLYRAVYHCIVFFLG